MLHENGGRIKEINRYAPTVLFTRNQDHRYNIMVQNTQTELDLMYPGLTHDCVSLFVP